VAQRLDFALVRFARRGDRAGPWRAASCLIAPHPREREPCCAEGWRCAIFTLLTIAAQSRDPIAHQTVRTRRVDRASRGEAIAACRVMRGVMRALREQQ
jgi:hypothetical protein